MPLCHFCEPLGTWILERVRSTKCCLRHLNSSEDAAMYKHVSTIDGLLQSASQGCDFCTHMVDAMRDESHAEKLDRFSSPAFLASLAKLQERGKPTNVEIGLPIPPFERLRVHCGGPASYARFSIYMLPEEVEAHPSTALRGMPHMSSHPLSETTWSIKRAWIRECIENHPECSISKPGFPPSRLIDVGPSDGSEEPRLVLAKDGFHHSTAIHDIVLDKNSIAKTYESDRLMYASLSHCWGKTLHLTTTLDTIKDRIHGIPMHQLPRTFQDAVKATRGFGLRYIWIDSLCIVQDSQLDWETESARMDSIYRNAVINIAATAAKDDDQSFLLPRTVAFPLPYRVVDPIQGAVMGSVWVRQRALYEAGRSTLDSRAWVTQEKLLSARILHYGRDQVFWMCRRYIIDEEDPYTPVSGDIPSDLTPRETSQCMAQALNGSKKATEPLVTWRKIVEKHSRKAITVSTDTLPALSGLASVVQEFTKDVYLAGLWTTDLPFSLRWRPKSESHRPLAYRAPSWSWACLDAEIEFPDTERWWQSQIEIIHAEISPAGTDPLGHVSSGHLHISGPTLPVTIKGSGALNARSTVIHGHSGHVLGYFITEVSRIRGSLRCMLMAVLDRSSSAPIDFDDPTRRTNAVSCMILEETGDSEGSFRRVGLMEKSRPIGLGIWNLAPRTEMIII